MSGSTSATASFIDLATFDAIEEVLYTGLEAITYFVRQTRKSSWFSMVPVVLANSSGSPGFGQTWSVVISRSGDYLLNAWLEVTLPALVEVDGVNKKVEDRMDIIGR